SLGWAVRNGPRLPGRIPIWLPKLVETKRRHLSHAEFERFYASVSAEHAKLYVMLGLYSMARPTAILQLEWDRVDFHRKQIDFTPPGHIRTTKRRTVVSISDDLLPLLEAAYSQRTSAYVIERAGEPIKCIKKAFQAASERSGVHATPYTLRHTGAVWAAEAGVSMAELAQFMGHDDDRTTQKHYARFSPEHLRGVANAIRRRP
ncbi:tyrosine-type recombinase/integrase, partial [Novosphingobium pentaromativorans]|uniref:tyrosine-type recombinase/integrase n=1 Tax=Novosphingobium pentaromativorans TaxID=205844 RepID=UPI00058708A8